jgi:hypothetical protein
MKMARLAAGCFSKMAYAMVLGVSGLSLMGEDAVPPLVSTNREPHVFAAIWENDMLYNPAPGRHQDRHYTQGLKFVFLDRDDPMPLWVRSLRLDKGSECLPSLGFEPTSRSFGLTLGQNIYTPEDDRATHLITSDRPYAAWLYTGAILQRRGLTGKVPTLESFELDLGVIGPEALGEEAQNTIHRWKRVPTFDGWANQLKTEPAFELKYGRTWRITLSEKTSRYFDILPKAGTALGTVRVMGEAGVGARLGWNLPEDFGLQRIDSPIPLTNGKHFGWLGFYAFCEVEGRAVGRNAFLDGNLWQAGPHVDKRPLVADWMYGLGLTLGKHLEASWVVDQRTKEFYGQNSSDRFGSLMMKCSWGF